MKLFSIEITLSVSLVVGAVIALPSLGFKPSEGSTATAAQTSAVPVKNPACGQVAVLAVVAPKPDTYGLWTTECGHKIHACEYTFSTTDGVRRTQTVVIWYADKDRNGWAYFYNADSKPWARCAVPGNAKYDAKAMCWECLKPDGTGYEPFKDQNGTPKPLGYCPTPKDGKSAIPLLPLPPK